MDYRTGLIAGIDLPIPECQLVIHQPSIKEIGYLGETDFLIGVQSLCVNKSMFSDNTAQLEQISNFQIFMTLLKDQETKEQRDAVMSVLKLLFPDYNVMTTPNSILFVHDGNTIMVDEKNFDFLQDIVRLICCLKDGPMDQQNFNPANDQAREIAQKLMRGRQRVAAQNGSANVSIFSQYVSILTVGLNSISIQDAINLTMYQLYDLVERYMLYVNWDLDIKQRLAGGKPDKPPDNWMKSIH